ncbi:hypothetical protein FGO68_gene15907 [Halteria grandinella]|uniref:Uncharacterized protein n=1 Tax=Halteria grandinella TaxID=5974 RepID=A0A8J8SUL9_HALGN|nr:hypothetical protein FGO68_gene15907 [Halteria grandinella]
MPRLIGNCLNASQQKASVSVVIVHSTLLLDSHTPSGKTKDFIYTSVSSQERFARSCWMAERMPRQILTKATLPSRRKRSMAVSMKLRSKPPQWGWVCLLSFWGVRTAKKVRIQGEAQYSELKSKHFLLQGQISQIDKVLQKFSKVQVDKP